ncbi:protein tyrosine phosphatase family protein [Ferrimonas lipolytica]|uniref:Phosphatase n=1 Tax=Ferrimonas lipolytica TaxID=2724191 RepID=A0A6H1UIY2_9GAMM|nr:protein tyrosine phosphatase family protein [Ferrimonas lipolytica]QIZ78176.1 hypothetical protein HER31_15465 [Ferrimonas lipolytica]
MKLLIPLALVAFSFTASAAIDSTQLPPVKALQQHNASLLSAGLPQAAEIPQLIAAGVDVVIDLIPVANGLENEAQLVHQADKNYYQIEVDWNNPTKANFEQFRQIMKQHNAADVLVHCQANYRASAFVYLYQLTEHGEDDLTIMAPWGDLQQSLAKYPQWQELIDSVKADIN